MAAYPAQGSNLISCVSTKLCVWLAFLHLRGEINERTIARPRDSCFLQFQPSISPSVPCVIVIYSLGCPLQWLWCKVLLSKRVAGFQNDMAVLVQAEPGHVSLIPFSLLTYKLACSCTHRGWETQGFTFRKFLSAFTLFSFSKDPRCILLGHSFSCW